MLLGLTAACRLAGAPTSTLPSAVKPTTEGVVSEPSWLGTGTGCPPSTVCEAAGGKQGSTTWKQQLSWAAVCTPCEQQAQASVCCLGQRHASAGWQVGLLQPTATAELVVPRSMPTTQLSTAASDSSPDAAAAAARRRTGGGRCWVLRAACWLLAWLARATIQLLQACQRWLAAGAAKCIWAPSLERPTVAQTLVCVSGGLSERTHQASRRLQAVSAGPSPRQTPHVRPGAFSGPAASIIAPPLDIVFIAFIAAVVW